MKYAFINSQVYVIILTIEYKSIAIARLSYYKALSMKNKYSNFQVKAITGYLLLNISFAIPLVIAIIRYELLNVGIAIPCIRNTK